MTGAINKATRTRTRTRARTQHVIEADTFIDLKKKNSMVPNSASIKVQQSTAV